MMRRRLTRKWICGARSLKGMELISTPGVDMSIVVEMRGWRAGALASHLQVSLDSVAKQVSP